MSTHNNTFDAQSAAKAARSKPGSRSKARRGQAPAPSTRVAREGGRASTTPRQWLDPSSAYDKCGVSPAEYQAALAAARKDLLREKKPVPAGTTPHLLITLGAPGAGKSTVSEAVAAERGSGDYVTIDMDVAVKYHPRYRDIWAAPSAVTGRPTEAGFTLTHLTCNYSVSDILHRICEEIMYREGGPRYNVILQSHDQMQMIHAKLAGYRVTLLFVGVPVEIAKARSRARAVETGKFLAPNLAAQDELVESMWLEYGLAAAWYGLWADEFLVADNRRKAKTDGDARKRILKYVKAVPLHCEDWDTCRRNAQEAILAACM